MPRVPSTGSAHGPDREPSFDDYLADIKTKQQQKKRPAKSSARSAQ
jgi:hypothetical protein